MNPNVTSVINPKSLEKQIKLYDTRLQVLKDEVDELEKLRAACHLLLGGSLTTEPAVEAVEPAKTAKGKKGASREDKNDDARAGLEAASEHGPDAFVPEPTVDAPQAEM